MPIDPAFPRNHQVIGKHRHSDGQHYHFVWGPGRLAAAAEAEFDNVKAAYAARNEELVPIGIHGTMVAVDWDCCIADGSCIDVCPVKLYEWYRTDNDIPAVDMADVTSNGDGSTNKEDRADYTDKSEPIREQDCIYCMACVAVCPTQSIKVEQSNIEFHQRASQTFG
jgi:NAD-dependent dihydropyrimidine dehydrogenase PreA subunit